VDATAQVAIVGAGPIGLELAIALKQAGIPYQHFDKGQIGQTISWFPEMMRFFSSPERIAIAGIPIPRTDQSKCTKEEYLAYLRAVVQQFDLPVRTYENVERIKRVDSGGFTLHSRDAQGQYHTCRAEKLVLAIGDMHRPHLIGVPGENLPHVSHYFHEPHRFFRKKLLVVGGKNSAVEAALRCWHCGAEVTLCYRASELDPRHIKYWVLPEIQGCVRRGEIRALPTTTPLAIEPGKATLRSVRGGEPFEIEADFILLLTGYEADMALFAETGVELTGIEQNPAFNPQTMETNVPGLYVAGTTTAGSQQSYQVFIETSHIHIDRILAAIQGNPPPPEEPTNRRPEN